MRRPEHGLATVWLVLAALSGCSVTASTSAFLDSSLASSASSSPEVRESGYHEDVRDLTAAHAATGGPFEAFQRHLGDLARKHGISDWEEMPITYAGIGHGLAKAQADAAALETYTRELAGSDTGKALAIRAAYAAERPDR